MGFLNKEEVVKDEETVLSKEYIVDDKKKCYNIVEEEKIYTNSKVLPIRNIIYDTNPLTGNVIKRQVKYNDSIYEEMY